jgi:hypothetical protein
MSELVKVGEVYLAQEGDNYVGTEVVFTENVRNKQGAAFVLDMLKTSMGQSGWTAITVMRVKDQNDAPTDESAGEGGDTDAESVGDAEETTSH